MANSGSLMAVLMAVSKWYDSFWTWQYWKWSEAGAFTQWLVLQLESPYTVSAQPICFLVTICWTKCSALFNCLQSWPNLYIVLAWRRHTQILVRIWVWYCSIGLWLRGVFQPNQERKCLCTQLDRPATESEQRSMWSMFFNYLSDRQMPWSRFSVSFKMNALSLLL